jgi:hypothetical protein
MKLPYPGASGKVSLGGKDFQELAETIDEKALAKTAIGNYGGQEPRTAGTEYEASATRPVFLTVLITLQGGGSSELLVNGKVVGRVAHNVTGSEIEFCQTAIVPTGGKWKVTAAAVVGQPHSTYLAL